MFIVLCLSAPRYAHACACVRARVRAPALSFAASAKAGGWACLPWLAGRGRAWLCGTLCRSPLSRASNLLSSALLNSTTRLPVKTVRCPAHLALRPSAGRSEEAKEAVKNALRPDDGVAAPAVRTRHQCAAGVGAGGFSLGASVGMHGMLTARNAKTCCPSKQRPSAARCSHLRMAKSTSGVLDF
jgi:hypothetical protein